MSRVVRPVAGFALAGFGASLAGALVVGGLTAPEEEALLLAGPHPEYSAGVHLSAYDLAKLKVLEPTLYHVEESYVEPERIDWEAMYTAGLQAVERRVPGFKFSRSVEASRVSLEVGDYSTVLEVAPVGSSRALQAELRRVAGLLQVHLSADDIPTSEGEDPHSEVEYALVNGVLDTLDPHSMLLPPEDASEMDVENQGEFGGLGVTIVEGKGALVVENTLTGTPAERAGVQKADRITRIAGHSTMNMTLDEAVHLLRGPVGAPITIEIMRDGFDDPRPFRIHRELIKLNEVAGVLLEGDVGLIRIQTFHRNVESELHAALARMKRESADGRLQGVILDLRDNPGGYLNQAVAVADTFLTSGEIVSTVDGLGRKQDVKHAQRTPRTEDPYPVVVLMNANSASASEIVAGALRNNERAVIVGERSFGKGSVQDLHQFYDASKLKLTISQYLTPGDHSIQSVGIPADVELRPVQIEPVGEDFKARVYWRERVRREADLDHRLDRSVRASDLSVETAYSFAYLEDGEAARRRPLDLTDYPTAFARDLVLGAGSRHRGEMLAQAAKVVDRHARKADQAIVKGFEEVGVDWADGPRVHTPGALPIRAELDLGADGFIDAGVREKVRLTVTNTSGETLHRLGVLGMDHDVLEGREMVFGRLEPGETRSFDLFVSLVDGYPSHDGDLTLSVRDGDSEPLGTTTVPVRIRGRALPDLTWSVATSEVEGNGDGLPQVGETLALDVTLRNRGAGISAAAFARLKNGAGAALDIGEGALEPGRLRLADGTLCDEEDRKAGCQKRLLPGESWTGRMTVHLKEDRPDGWPVDLLVGDDEAYDHASIVSAGLHEHFSQKQTLTFIAEALPASPESLPPTIEVRRSPASTTKAERVTISGRVADDVGIRHVMVFAGDDKLFYQGEEGGVRSVPFTADVPLEEGVNVISVVVEDEQGFTHTTSVVTERLPDARVSRKN